MRTWSACSAAVTGRPRPFAVLAGMGEASTDSLAQYLAFELGEDGQQRGHCATCRCGQVQRFGQRHEADAEMLQFLQRGKQVGDRSSPAIQPPHHNHIDLPAPRRFQQFLAALPLYCTGADFFHLHGRWSSHAGRHIRAWRGSAWAASADPEWRRGHRGRREPFWRSFAPGRKPSRIF